MTGFSVYAILVTNGEGAIYWKNKSGGDAEMVFLRRLERLSESLFIGKENNEKGVTNGVR